MKKSILILVSCMMSIILFQAFTATPDPHFKNLHILPKDISMHDLDSVMHHFNASLGVKCNFCHVINEDTKKRDFANDDKPEKMIARKMMLMSIDLNKNYFKDMDEDMEHHDMDKDMLHDSVMIMDHNNDKAREHPMDTTQITESVKYMLSSVTCFTCHRGDPHPETKTPPHKDGPPQVPPKTEDNK
ncbi:MAG: c-type cytochrome [Ginsengibacter sp.]